MYSIRIPMRSLLFAIALFLFSAANALAENQVQPFEPVEHPKWKLVFEDQFNGPINERIWSIEEGMRFGAMRSRDNAFTTNGVLNLRVSRNEDGYDIGFLRSRRLSKLLFAQKYGYFEARMKLAIQPGQWGAFWLMPKGTIHNVDGSGRDGTEIDIVEGFYDDPAMEIGQAIHYDGYQKERQTEGNGANVPGGTDQWHTYGLMWCDDSYTWFVDGVETWTITDPNQISQVKQYMLLTSEIRKGSDWAGDIEEAQLPADTLVDYVRVYKENARARSSGPSCSSR